MKTKQELIDRICKRSITEGMTIRELLTEELPDFNPYRIDEERMIELCNKAKVGYYSSWFGDLIQQYNSTAPEPLKPLPKEIPEGFEIFRGEYVLWKQIIKHFGTPSKPSLPSVEELKNELFYNTGLTSEMRNSVARYLHSKYALHSQDQEWWMKLKKGDRFIFTNKITSKVVEFDGIIDVNNGVFLGNEENGLRYDVNYCTPYAESELEKGLKTADENTKNLIKLACE